EHVHAGLDQPGDHLLAAGGRAQGRHDLGAPLDHRRNAPRPRNRAVGPSSSSMSSSRLYFAVRSLRLAEPVLIWPAFTATARSEMKVSSVSPERWLITFRKPAARASSIASSASVSVPIWFTFTRIALATSVSIPRT